MARPNNNKKGKKAHPKGGDHTGKGKRRKEGKLSTGLQSREMKLYGVQKVKK